MTVSLRAYSELLAMSAALPSVVPIVHGPILIGTILNILLYGKFLFSYFLCFLRDRILLRKTSSLKRELLSTISTKPLELFALDTQDLSCSVLKLLENNSLRSLKQ